MATMAAAATRAKPRWGDDDDDDDEDDDEQQQQQQQSNEASSRYQPQRSRIDAHGIQYSTTYRDSGNGTRIKVIQKIRVTKELVKESKGVAERRLWKKFGLAASSADSSSTTIPSRDDVYLEDPKAEGGGGDGSGAPEDDTKALSGNLNAFWAKQQRRQLERKYDVAPGSSLNASGTAATGASAGANPTTSSALDSAAAATGAAAADDSAEGGGWTQVTGSGGGGGGNNAGGGGSGGGKYVIPRARGAAAGGASSSSGGGSGGLAGVADRVAAAAAAAGGGGGGGNRTDDLNTIRVTNISENTTEADLQELFQVFGRISRVYLAKDKETMVSRGFAFVSFVHKEEAALAMEKLQGYGYDHLILKLEWAKPSAPKDPASAGTEYRSGYGKALAQDTKEKVSYASNLTRGTR